MKNLTDPCIAGLKAVLEHAKNYVDGERLQIEMEFNDEKISEVGPAMRGDTTPKKEVDPNFGKGDETVTPKDEETAGGDFEDDGINTTKDVRDDSEDELQEPPE